MYSRRQLDEMGSGGLWINMGLHRGLICTMPSSYKGEDSEYWGAERKLYYLGNSDAVGLLGPDGRQVFALVHFPTHAEYVYRLNPHRPLEGPVLPQRFNRIQENLNLHNAHHALKMLGGGVAIPRHTFRLKPKTIAPDDVPDVGVERASTWVTKPKLFKLKGKQ